MRRRAWLVATWVAVTGLVSWVTFQALASAEEGVGTDALPAVVVEGTGPERTSTTAESTSSSAPAEPSTTAASAPDATTDPEEDRETPAESDAPSPTSAAPAGSAVPPSSAPATTSPTTAPTATVSSTTPSSGAPSAAWETHVVSSGGGTVTVRFRPGEVEYQAAVPAPGFAVEVERRSPEVRVEFVGEDAEWDVRVRWSGDGLDVDVSD